MSGSKAGASSSPSATGIDLNIAGIFQFAKDTDRVYWTPGRKRRYLMAESAPYATVSGSFRRAMSAVQDAVYRLTDAGARVLSPADPRVVDQFGDFLFVASDRVRAIKLVQNRHLAAVEASDFLWLVAPNGYIGQSGAMELGFAVSVGTPVFSSEVPADLTLRQYVTTLRAPEDALRASRNRTAQSAGS